MKYLKFKDYFDFMMWEFSKYLSNAYTHSYMLFYRSIIVLLRSWHKMAWTHPLGVMSSTCFYLSILWKGNGDFPAYKVTQTLWKMGETTKLHPNHDIQQNVRNLTEQERPIRKRKVSCTVTLTNVQHTPSSAMPWKDNNSSASTPSLGMSMVHTKSCLSKWT